MSGKLHHITSLPSNAPRAIALALIAVFIFSSCQKVINLNLNTSAGELVIEGYVTDQPGIDTVKLSLTNGYYNTGNHAKVNGALVIIADNTGLTDTLVQVDSGTYAHPTLQGVPARTYTLKVITGGKENDAVCAMPSPVNIDSVIAFQHTNSSGAFDSTYRANCYFKDPPGIGNYYRLQLLVNGTVLDSAADIMIYYDGYSDGKEESDGLSNAILYTGDSITFQLMCIDKNTYNYFNTLSSLVTAPGLLSTGTPQNPPTNIIGGAVGYFSANTLRTKTTVVP
jgi:hypothetical protein